MTFSGAKAIDIVKPPGVTVLTRQVLDDMDATTLRDALRYVTGVTLR